MKLPSPKQLNDNEDDLLLSTIRGHAKRISQQEGRAAAKTNFVNMSSANAFWGTGNPFNIEDPFTGTAIVYPAFADASGDYHIFGMSAGVLQWGANSNDGKIYSGGGVVVQDADGITIDISTFTVPDKLQAYSFSYGALADIGGLYGYANPQDYSLLLKIDPSTLDATASGGIFIIADSAASGAPVVRISAATPTVSNSLAIYHNYTIINEVFVDADTIIRGDTTSIATFDAGLEAVGFGGAASSGYILTLTGKLKLSSDLDINTNKFNVVGSSGNTTIAGTLGVTDNVAVNTNKFSVVASSGNTTIAGTLGVTGNVAINTNKFNITAASGNTTIAGTLDVTGALTVGGGASIAVIDAGVYTPALSNTTNVAASTAYQCQYMRVGSVVTVSGAVDVDPTTTATATLLGIALPIASNIGAAEDVGGAAGGTAVGTEVAGIDGDAANNRASMRWVCQSAANHKMAFCFSYRII